MGFLIFLLVITGCGDTWEDKLLSPFAIGLKDGIDQSGSKGMTAFIGTMEVSNMDEIRTIAAEDFSGKIIRDPKVTMNLKIEKSGLISEGNIEIRVQDRDLSQSQPYFYFRATCAVSQDKQCGSFKDKKLNVSLYDSGGFVGLTSIRSTNNEFHGFVTLDGHEKKLGEFSLTKEDSQNEKVKDKSEDKNKEESQWKK